jgi:hypothetical protein
MKLSFYPAVHFQHAPQAPGEFEALNEDPEAPALRTLRACGPEQVQSETAISTLEKFPVRFRLQVDDGAVLERGGFPWQVRAPSRALDNSG